MNWTANRRMAVGKQPVLLGDRVERAVAPIARLFRVEHCLGCKRRKRWLNRLDAWVRVTLKRANPFGG